MKGSTILEDGEEMTAWDCCDLLNEQQSDLVYLARFIGEFKVEEFKLKLRDIRILEDKVDEQQSTINEIEKNFEDLVDWSTEIAKRNVLLDEKIGRLQQEIQVMKNKLNNDL